MKILRSATHVHLPMILCALLGVCPAPALAQEGHAHAAVPQNQLTAAQGALLKTIRDATERYKDVSVAEADGYTLTFGCVTGPDAGAMGLHYVNFDLVQKGIIDPNHPQIVIYEPTSDGRVHLIGADFLVMADQWDKAHPGQGAPQLMGQLFHYFESPNRFGLPPFYTLHVWAWKNNPNGAFVNWHPSVSCASYSAQ